MAVGIPGRRASRSLPRGRDTASSPFVLEYPGKKSLQEILSTPPGRFSTSTSHRAGENRLYHAENLATLASLARDESVSGKIRLVYIDPPFSTESAFHSRSQRHAYDDHLAGADFVEALRERLVFIHRLLSADGSLYLHLDERMICHARLVLDEIFGERNFRNLITRKKCNPKNYTRRTFGNIADYILFYSKTDTYVWNRALEKWTDARALKEYEYVDEKTGRRFKKVPIHAPGSRNGATGGPWRGMMPPPGKHWQFRPSTLDEIDARGDMYWSSNGNPRRKVYLDESSGVSVQDIWMDFKDAHNQNVRVTGYPTEKNPGLLARIIAASSNPGDLVLDCYSGSGTTLAEASRLGRRWIGVDRSDEAIRTTLKRFKHGVERMGDFVGSASTTNEVQPLFDLISDFTLYEEMPTSAERSREAGNDSA